MLKMCKHKIKDSDKILNQEAKGIISIFDFVHTDLRRVACFSVLCSLE